MPLTAADRENNLLFEVQDTSGWNNPEALSLHVFAGKVPEDRATEYRADRAQSGDYTVYKSTVSLSLADGNADRYFLSVHCSSVAAATFTALVSPVIAPLPTLAHWLHGEACPGAWTYHHLVPGDHYVGESNDSGDDHRRQQRRRRRLGTSYYGGSDDGSDDGSDTSSGSSYGSDSSDSSDSSESSYYADTDDGAFANVSLTLRVTVSLLSGELTMVGRNGHAPVKIAPPFAVLDAPGSNRTIILCDVDPQKSYYVGIDSNGETCAAYEVRAEVSAAQPGDEARCAAERRALDEGGDTATTGATEVAFDTLLRGSVTAGVYADYRIGAFLSVI